MKPILIPLCSLLVILTVEKGVSEESLTDQAPVATGGSSKQTPDAVALQWSSEDAITMTGPHDLHQLVLTSHEGDGKKDVTAIAELHK